MNLGVTPGAYLEKAERALAAAEILLNADSPEGACNRAYYAMFDQHMQLCLPPARAPAA